MAVISKQSSDSDTSFSVFYPVSFYTRNNLHNAYTRKTLILFVSKQENGNFNNAPVIVLFYTQLYFHGDE